MRASRTSGMSGAAVWLIAAWMPKTAGGIQVSTLSSDCSKSKESLTNINCETNSRGQDNTPDQINEHDKLHREAERPA